MRVRTEVSYAFFLFLVMTGVVSSISFLFQKFSVGSLIYTAVDTCCQLLVRVTQTGAQVVGVAFLTMLLTASAFLVLKTFFSLLKSYLFSRQLLNSRSTRSYPKLVSLCRKHDIPLAKVLVTDRLPLTVFTAGLINPKIVMSETVLLSTTQRELEAILLHETYHLHRHHPALFMIGDVIGRSFSFMPVVQDVLGYLKLNLETDADAFAASIQGSSRYLKRALLKVSAVKKVRYVSFYPAFSAEMVSERVKAVMNNSRPRYAFSLSHLLTSFLFVLFLVFLINIPIYAATVSERSQSNQFMCRETTQTGAACGGTQNLNQSRVPTVSSAIP